MKGLGPGFRDKDSLAGLSVPNQRVRANDDGVSYHFIGTWRMRLPISS